MNVLTRLNPFRTAVETAFPARQTDAQFRVGETLPDAFARRLGISHVDKPTVDPLDMPHPSNRAARRAARERVDVLNSYARTAHRRKASR